MTYYYRVINISEKSVVLVYKMIFVKKEIMYI